MTTPSDTPADVPQLWIDSLATIALSAWTLRRKSAQTQSDSDMSSRDIHIDAICDALQDIGVEIQEYVDHPYRSGLNVDILVFQPDPNVEEDKITATVRPAVLFHGRMIQRGQVIVSTPEQGKQS